MHRVQKEFCETTTKFDKGLNGKINSKFSRCAQGGSKVREGAAFEDFRETLHGDRSVSFEVMSTM